MDFVLSTYYNAFDVDNDYDIDSSSIEQKIDAVTNALAHSPEAILNPEVLEESIDIIHGFSQLEDKPKKLAAFLVSSSFNNACHQCILTMDLGDFIDMADNLKNQLERYGYLMFVLLSFLGKEEIQVSTRQKLSSVKWKNNCTQVEDALDAVAACMKIDLSKLFVTTPERTLYLDMFIRPIFRLMESPDRMKLLPIKTLMFRNLAFAVTKHGMGIIVQNAVIQSLTYYIHLPPYMAELMHILSKQYDHITLTEDLLREISQLEFNANDTNGPKAVSEFLIKLSELSPRLILKQMSSTSQLLDNSNQSLRCSVVETCGNIVVDILKSESEDPDGEDEHSANRTLQVDGLLNLLEERFLDQNPFVRTKAIQAMVKICSLPVRIPKRRQSVMLYAVRSLADRSTLVRRNAIKLMYKLLLTHPFSAAHGTQLEYKVWKKRLDDAEADLNKYLPKVVHKMDHKGIQGNEKGSEELNTIEETDKMDVEEVKEDNTGSDDSDSEIDHDELNESMMEQERQLPETEVLVRAKLTVQYYEDAIEFIEAVQQGTKVTSTLLFSKNRNEVLESMDFLVLADAYGIENASEGIRKMLHLVWMKGSSDEGKSISSHLIDCYKDLFLTAPKNASANQTAVLFAKNLIGLTVSASVADLASLEKLLCLMYQARYIHTEVVKVLWLIYNKAGSEDSDYPKNYIHGAIIILGMLSLAENSIVQMGVESLLNVGLGDVGKEDLELCKYSCSTLAKISTADLKSATTFKFPTDDPAIKGLQDALLLFTDKPEWYGVAEQAVSAIFMVSADPEEVCSQVIKDKVKQVFGGDLSQDSQVVALSQLLFVVGHVAIKTIEHLEKLEALFKKRKHENEAKKSKAKEDGDENELEMIGGTSEDDFTDAVIYIKERELLFGEKSLLARFGPLAKEICSDTKAYSNEILQRSATLCLGKLMCVSSKFCEDNLPLLITIMEKSPDPVIRSNCVLGLGDMAVCFNNLVDENTDFLYRRLTDDNIMVQRTCLMTVTFLILAGQVKVKGQLSSMAKCLENPDQSISDMCRLFFTELATKDNAIYNGFIDIFSGLSHDKTLSKESMKRIIKFLVGFIEKEKHQKQLADKLLVRLMKCQTESQWEDVAYVLSTIPYKNDSISQALEGGYKMVLARD
ncbi:CIC11C00000005324 [Sungouiella intermedia]|uniref:Condensin complex subunit 1 n=1 Tax=Sungouiella intermedia TaxID=45354 RepID=A0A1L0DFH2_9ASCO|nr:CIC11C00000005324 [[Candida] intermedia]